MIDKNTVLGLEVNDNQRESDGALDGPSEGSGVENPRGPAAVSDDEAPVNHCSARDGKGGEKDDSRARRPAGRITHKSLPGRREGGKPAASNTGSPRVNARAFFVRGRGSFLFFALRRA